MWLFVDIVANLVVAVACTWAIMTPRVNDGLFGKLVFIVLCFAALSNAAWAMKNVADIDRPEVVFNSAVALVAIRCWWIKTYRANLRRWGRRCRE